MAEQSQKPKSEVWNFFQKVDNSDRTKCKFCDAIWSYKSKSTKGMWDHVKAKHSFQMADDK